MHSKEQTAIVHIQRYLRDYDCFLRICPSLTVLEMRSTAERFCPDGKTSSPEQWIANASGEASKPWSRL